MSSQTWDLFYSLLLIWIILVSLDLVTLVCMPGCLFYFPCVLQIVLLFLGQFQFIFKLILWESFRLCVLVSFGWCYLVDGKMGMASSEFDKGLQKLMWRVSGLQWSVFIKIGPRKEQW